MKRVLFIAAWLIATSMTSAAESPARGVASWYGEAHRGKLMANGKKFNPDKLTAASWFYPLGTKVRVKVRELSGAMTESSVLVTITDRGPAKYLVRRGRIIDLAHSAFKELAHPDLGLVRVTVEEVEPPAETTRFAAR
jgi:rare lipoprotein A